MLCSESTVPISERAMTFQIAKKTTPLKFFLEHGVGGGGGGAAGVSPAMVWVAAWLGPTLPTIDHHASWGGWDRAHKLFPAGRGRF